MEIDGMPGAFATPMAEHTTGGLRCQLSQAKAENERLEAIVDKLPKTADGVSVAPGDSVYRQWWNQPTLIIEYQVVSLPEDKKIGRPRIVHRAACIPSYSTGWKLVSKCYSTRKAAEAAKEEK